ncbi:MAG: DmsE family decaheme c-type cytochrome [Acidobacteria bacterium]|nr:DmsE family decaheme c-type cytochrome [Acidobacteriota bacterium]
MKLLKGLAWFTPLIFVVNGALGGEDNPPGVESTSTEPPSTYVGDAVCLECHEDHALPQEQIHARIRSFEVQGRVVGCEGCHGPGSRHAEEAEPDLIRSFAAGGIGDEACLTCHRVKGLPQWPASTHALESVGCADCHAIHSTSEPMNTCRTCHGEVMAEFELPSHHPLPEGKMDCASCHDVHNAREAHLRTAQRLNDLCFDCHASIEGPFIFEHEPVQEDCRTCHLPHGAVADNLLTANEPTLCLQCHEPHFHSGYRASEDDEVDVGGIERGNPFGTEGMNIAFTTSCTQCHSQVHGSDLPSQTVPGQGRGLSQ